MNNTPQTIEPSAGVPSTPLLERATAAAGALARRGTDALGDSSRHLRYAAWRASDNSVRFVRNEPVKAVLIAAATGALLTALVGLLTRPRTGA